MRCAALLLGLALSLAGCGYHVPGTSGGALSEVQTLYVQLFENERFEPFLENELTNAVSSQLARKRDARLVESAVLADAVLSGTITDYQTAAVSYNRDDNIAEYRSTMTIVVMLRRTRDNKILWKGNASWSKEYFTAIDKTAQEDNEAEAIDEISRRLAEEIYYRITDDF